MKSHDSAFNPEHLNASKFCRAEVWQELHAIDALVPHEKQHLLQNNRADAWDLRRNVIAFERATLYARIRQDAEFTQLIQNACRDNILYWFRYFAWTYDPRPNPQDDKASRRSIGTVPMVLYPFQMETVLRLNDAIEAGDDLIIEKSRDMGLSWLLCLVFQYRWQFREAQQFLVGSRNFASASVKGDLSTLMEKCRFNLKEQPPNFLPAGFEWRKHDVNGTLKNPLNGNQITPEASTENFARGGRYTAVLMDEFAFWMNADSAYASAGQSTLCRLVVSTPNGKHNRFAIERFSGLTPVITLHWTLHPLKDLDWYTQQKKRLLSHEIARELDISYEYTNRDKVFDEFTASHLAEHLDYDPALPILRSWDFGYHAPAVLALQRDAFGRIRVLKEWVGHRVVLAKFAEEVITDCKRLFSEVPIFQDVCDPAGHQHNDKSEHTSIEVLRKLGVHPEGVRCGVQESIDKIRHLLIEERQSDEGLTPAFLVDATQCPTLVDALQGGYRYKFFGSEELAQEHPFEDVADCLRYAVWRWGMLLVDSNDYLQEQRKWAYRKWQIRQYQAQRQHRLRY